MKIMSLTSNKKYQFGFIVEGHNDERKLRSAMMGEFPVVVLGGDGLAKDSKITISEVMSICEHLFIMTDCDEAGDNVAKKIQDLFDLPRIELDKKQCVTYMNGFKKKKYGLEYALPEYVRMVVSDAFKERNLPYEVPTGKRTDVQNLLPS